MFLSPKQSTQVSSGIGLGRTEPEAFESTSTSFGGCLAAETAAGTTLAARPKPNVVGIEARVLRHCKGRQQSEATTADARTRRSALAVRGTVRVLVL